MSMSAWAWSLGGPFAAASSTGGYQFHAKKLQHERPSHMHMSVCQEVACISMRSSWKAECAVRVGEKLELDCIMASTNTLLPQAGCEAADLE